MTAVDVTVRTPDARLDGRLAVFPGATAVVAFAHGSGSSRHSPRNRAVAEELNRVGVATLLLDLLTPEEERADSATGRQRFDIDLLTRRLTGTVDWLAGHEDTAGTPIGLFGASTGAAAALVAAAKRPATVGAIVSRGGRPDLAGDALPEVHAATLLIVGGNDDAVISLNREAFARFRCEKEMKIIPSATHLFEEPGALEEVANLAAQWFQSHLQIAHQSL